MDTQPTGKTTDTTGNDRATAQLGVRSDVGCGGRSGLGFWGVRDVHKKGTKS